MNLVHGRDARQGELLRNLHTVISFRRRPLCTDDHLEHVFPGTTSATGNPHSPSYGECSHPTVKSVPHKLPEQTVTKATRNLATEILKDYENSNLRGVCRQVPFSSAQHIS